jgi:AGZA family xanthine/uracil permease-like MFS transporter
MPRYHWARRGDVNAFFGLMLDNVAVMLILFTLVTSTTPVSESTRPDDVRFTPEFVLTRMIPGTALGVLIGDLVFTWMAFRLARRTGRDDVTAMPLGLDTPSTFGITFLVLLPALKAGWLRYDGHPLAERHELTMHFAWMVGLLTLVMSGVFKLALAPFGNAVRRLVPRAGLLGSLAAIALALIAFLPLLLDGIAGAPVVGMLALVIILITLVAHRELPGRFPGALAAALVGAAVFWLGRALEGWGVANVAGAPKGGGAGATWEPLALVSFWGFDAELWRAAFEEALRKLPVALPFALATIVGGIDCTESAASAGDEYDTSAILMTEGAASLIAGLLGGVIQTTPYIGQPAYKKMGGRAAYTLAAALFIGAVGLFGGFDLLFNWLPKGALFGILIFVGLEITAQSFHATPPRHYPALALAMMPALAALILLVVKNLFGPAVPAGAEPREVLVTLRCLANGFIITSLLWAAALAMILDGKLRTAAVYFLVAGVCAFFGIIHSPLGDERIDLPWRVLAELQSPPETGGPGPLAEAVKYQTPYHWAAAYALMALVLWGLGSRRLAPAGDEPRPSAV